MLARRIFSAALIASRQIRFQKRLSATVDENLAALTAFDAADADSCLCCSGVIADAERRRCAHPRGFGGESLARFVPIPKWAASEPCRNSRNNSCQKSLREISAVLMEQCVRRTAKSKSTTHPQKLREKNRATRLNSAMGEIKMSGTNRYFL